MWFKLDKADENCFAINREIVYAYFILKEYMLSGREKYACCSPSTKNYHLKKLYISLKSE